MKHIQIQKVTLAHVTSIASKTILPKIFNISKLIRLDVYGNPSEELQKVIASFNSQTFNIFTGFIR